MAEIVRADEETIKLSLHEEQRMCIFKIPMSILREFARNSEESPYFLTHERAIQVLRSLYDLPSDAHVNWMHMQFGFASVEVVVTSKEFAPMSVLENQPIPEWPHLPTKKGHP